MRFIEEMALLGCLPSVWTQAQTLPRKPVVASSHQRLSKEKEPNNLPHALSTLMMWGPAVSGESPRGYYAVTAGSE